MPILKIKARCSFINTYDFCFFAKRINRHYCIYWVSGVFVLSRMIKSNHRSNQKVLYGSIMLIT